MVSSYSLALRDALAKEGVELLDVYRYQMKKKEKEGVIIKDVLRILHKETGKVYLVDLGSAKETMTVETVVEKVLKAITPEEGKEKKQG